MTTTESQFPAMNGFDLDAAMKRLMGRADLLRQVMQVFAANSRNASQCMRDFFSRQDVAGAQALAHQIKGSAANIGANTLSGVAASIESRIKAGDTSIPHDLLDQFEQALNVVLLDIQRLSMFEATSRSLNAVAALDQDRVLSAVRLIDRHIRADLDLAGQALERLTELTADTELQGWVTELNQAFRQFRMLDVASMAREFLADPEGVKRYFHR